MFLEVVNFSKIYEKIQEAKTLQAYVLETETKLTQASAQLVSAGIKTSNIKKIVQDIDVSGKPINQIFFKNTNGVLSFSLVQINQAFDQQMRTILGPLLGRSITVAAIDKPKRNQIALISKEVARYGMKSSDFNNLLKKIFILTSPQEYVVYTSDGYIVSFDAEETPVGGGGGNGGGTVVSPPRIGFIIEGQDSRMSFFEVSNGGVWGGTDGIGSNSYIAITTPFSNSESPFVRMSFSVTDTPESWGPAQGYVGSRFSYSKNVGVEYMYYSGEGYNPASSPVGVMDLIPDEELSDAGITGVLQGQTLHVGAIRSSDGIIPGLYNIKVEYINRNQAELGNYTPYYEKNFYFTISNLSNGNGYGQYDQYSEYDNQVSLDWFEEVSVPPIPGLPSAILIENIRSGSNVPVGTSSVFETTVTNTEGDNSQDELVYLQFIVSGTGQLRVYVNGITHFRYPEDIGTTKEIHFEYSTGEPGAWQWSLGSRVETCSSEIVNQQFIDMVSAETGMAYDPSTWMFTAGDDIIVAFPAGLMRGTNSLQIEFIPSSQGSYARMLVLSQFSINDGKGSAE